MIWNDFSIIIVTKNRPAQLRQSITAIKLNSYKPRVIIIIDNSDMMRRDENCTFLTSYKYSPIRINYISKSTSNLAACRNIGLSLVKTKYFGYIDDDQYIPVDWIKNVRLLFLRNPHIDVLSGPTKPNHVENYWNRVWSDIDHFRQITEGQVKMISSGNTCFRTKFLRAHHIQFDTHFTLAAEDWGISHALLTHHAYMYHTPKLAILHDYRTNFIDFIKQWFIYGIGISQYHRYYYVIKNATHLKKLCVSFHLFTHQIPRFPIYPNTHKKSLLPGYIILNMSYFSGYFYHQITTP